MERSLDLRVPDYELRGMVPGLKQERKRQEGKEAEDIRATAREARECRRSKSPAHSPFSRFLGEVNLRSSLGRFGDFEVLSPADARQRGIQPSKHAAGEGV